MNIELKQAAQQALLALENSQPHPSNPAIGLTKQDFIDHEETIRQLRNALQQSAPAVQAEVTDEQIKEAATKAVKAGKLSWVWFEKDDQDKYTIPTLSKSHYQLVRAGLALRPERVPMTEDQVWHNDALMSANGIAGFKMDALLRIVRAAESHHGITAQAKKEGT